jgi:hypothetical protein
MKTTYDGQVTAQKLLECLNMPCDQKVTKVCVTKVALEVQLDNDCDCD